MTDKETCDEVSERGMLNSLLVEGGGHGMHITGKDLAFNWVDVVHVRLLMNERLTLCYGILTDLIISMLQCPYIPIALW